MRRNINYKKIAPPGTFIADYMDYMGAQETPSEYDFWCAVWALGTVIGRDFVVDRPRAPVFMNWFIVLVGESGMMRKTSSIKSITRVCKPILDMDMIEIRTSAEQLEYKLHDLYNEGRPSQVSIVIPELVTFLGKGASARGMPTLLTDLYDCPDTRDGEGTVGHGRLRARSVFVSFLSASTSAWLSGAVHRDVIEGGFTSRVMFVVAEKRKQRIAWPEDTGDVRADIVGGLRDKLVSIRDGARSRGSIGLSATGLRAFVNWYNRRNESTDAYQASFEGREDSHVLRLCACLAANDGSWLIGAEHVRVATRIMAEIKRNGAKQFINNEVDTELYRAIVAVREKLVAHGAGGVTKSQLTRSVSNWVNAHELNQLLVLMHENNMITMEKVHKHRGAPLTVYTAMSGLHDPATFTHVWKLWNASS